MGNKWFSIDKFNGCFFLVDMVTTDKLRAQIKILTLILTLVRT